MLRCFRCVGAVIDVSSFILQKLIATENFPKSACSSEIHHGREAANARPVNTQRTDIGSANAYRTSTRPLRSRNEHPPTPAHRPRVSTGRVNTRRAAEPTLAQSASELLSRPEPEPTSSQPLVSYSITSSRAVP